MGSLSNWRKITPAFENDYQILTFDQRGHGQSFKPETGYAPADFAGDLLEIVIELGWEKINLVGHSMGGRNALEFAHLFPQRTEKLVIEDITPGTGRDAMLAIEKLIELVPTPFPTRISARTFFDSTYENLISFHPQPRVISRFLYSNLEEKPNGEWDFRFFKKGILEALHAGHAQNRWETVEKLPMPVLWMRGEISTDLSRPVFEEILQRNPHVRGVEIAGAGHWIHFDQPSAFIAALKDFLTDRSEVV
jgi:esterase